MFAVRPSLMRANGRTSFTLPASLVHFIWMVCEIGDKLRYSCCFMGCYFKDLLKTARNILVKFPLSVSPYVLLESRLCIHALTQLQLCPVGWGCRIHRLLLCRRVTPTPNECPRYDTKQSDGEVPAMLELWRMRSTPSLPLLPGPLWPGVIAPDRALSMG